MQVIRAVTLMCAVLAALPAAPMVASMPDPIEGRWFGQVGFPEDRVDIGLEFRRNPVGDLKVYLYQPVINFYGLELPGVLQVKGSHYELKEYGYAIDRKADRLEGTFSSLKNPMILRRTDYLPSEVPVPALPAGPEPLWQTKLGAPIYATAAVREGMAYVGTTGGVMHAVRIKDGSIAWTFNAGRSMFGEVAIGADAIYFVCDNGFLFKLDRATGREMWRYDMGDARVARILPHPTVFEWDFKAPRPTLSDDILYVGSGDGSLHAVRAGTGTRVWRFEPPTDTSVVSVGGHALEQHGKVRADAVVDGQHVIFGSFDGNVYALDTATGRQVWKKNTGARVDSTPVVMGNHLLVGNYGGLLTALDKDSSAVAWRRIWWGSAVESTPVVYGGLAYIGASDLRRITCFDPELGKVLWRTDVYGWPWGRPAVTNTLIYTGVAGGSPYDIRHLPSLTAIDRKTGTIAWRRPMQESGFVYGFVASPAIEGTSLVIGSLDGTLYAFPAS